MPNLPDTLTVTLRNETSQPLRLAHIDINKTVSLARASSTLQLTPTHGSPLLLFLSTDHDVEKAVQDGVQLSIRTNAGTFLLPEGETGAWWVYQRSIGKREVELVVYDRVDTASWMGQLSDDVLLSSLDLPGTHVSLRIPPVVARITDRV